MIREEPLDWRVYVIGVLIGIVFIDLGLQIGSGDLYLTFFYGCAILILMLVKLLYDADHLRLLERKEHKQSPQ